MAFKNDGRFQKFENKVWLSSPTMYPESMQYALEAYKTNWMSTVGANINEVEKIAANKEETKYAVALSCGTAALHLCMKLAGEKLYEKKLMSKEGMRISTKHLTHIGCPITFDKDIFLAHLQTLMETVRDGKDDVILLAY